MRLNRIKLNALSESCLQDKEMNAIVGGHETCRCSCTYADQGGSSESNNMMANAADLLYSETGCNQLEYNPTTGNVGWSGNATAS